MHKILFTWFDNLPMSRKLQGFHYYQEKYKVRQYSFSLAQKIITRNPNHQNNVFYILRTRFTMDYKTGQKIFLKALPPDLSHSTHGLSLRKSPLKTTQHYFRLNRHLNQTQLDSTKPNKSPTWRLVQSPTSTASLQKTVLHPCNSSSCPQGRRSTEVAHSFSFSIVTPLVNMSAGFLDPQIFSSIISLSSTR